MSNKIKEFRQELGLTVRDLADRAGCTVGYLTGYLSDVENDIDGVINLTKNFMDKIANALGKTVPEVFYPEDKSDGTKENREIEMRLSVLESKVDVLDKTFGFFKSPNKKIALLEEVIETMDDCIAEQDNQIENLSSDIKRIFSAFGELSVVFDELVERLEQRR